MSDLEMHYALPLSRLRISSTVTTSNDSVLEKETRAPQSTVTLEVGASEGSRLLKAHAGWIFNTGISLELTEEGLLKSSGIEAGGELGKIVVGVVGAATTIAAMALSPAKLAPGLGSVDMARTATISEGPRRRSPEETEAAAFAAHDRVAAELRTKVRALIAQVNSKYVETAERLLAAERLGETRDLQRRLLYLDGLLHALQSRLEDLNEVFRAWRATTIATKVEQYERLISLDDVREAAIEVTPGGVLQMGDKASPKIKKTWNELGVAVTVEPKDAPAQEVPSDGGDQILVREPRMVVLNVYEKQGEKAVLRESKPHLVMDSACVTRAVKLHKSAWAKRGVSLGFNALGGLSSFKYQGDSAAAAIAGTAGSLPGTVVDSLEKGGKARELLGSLDRSGVEQRLAKVKAETELKQQELTGAGLAATGADYAALERLKQQAEILERQKTIRETTPTPPVVDQVAVEIAQLKQQVELLKLRSKLESLS